MVNLGLKKSFDGWRLDTEARLKKPKLSNQEKGLLKLKNDPSLFVREILGPEPETWQTEALQAIRDHDRVAVKSGHSVGKSCFQSWMVPWFLSTHYPAKTVLTVNTSFGLSSEHRVGTP